MPKVSKPLPGRLESDADRGYLAELSGVRYFRLSDVSRSKGAMGIIASDIRRRIAGSMIEMWLHVQNTGTVFSSSTLWLKIRAE